MNTELYNALSAIPRDDLSLFLSRLVKLFDAAEEYRTEWDYDEDYFDPYDGICGNVRTPPTVGSEGKEALFRAWPEFSGCPVYPVPGIGLHPGDYDSDTDEYTTDYPKYSEDDAEHTFDETTDKWDDEYGASRLRLLSFMIEQLTEYLSKPEPAPVTAATYKPAHGGYPGIVR